MRFVLIALLLAGCGTTPKEVMESGTRTVHALKLPADRAAHCLARNIENYRAGFIGTVRPDDGGYEVVSRAGEHTFFVSRVEPMNTGSRATVWYRGYMAGGEEARAAMLAGC